MSIDIDISINHNLPLPQEPFLVYISIGTQSWGGGFLVGNE